MSTNQGKKAPAKLGQTARRKFLTGAAAATAGAAPGDCVFVDDRPDFVEGARATGMAGVTYRSGLDIEGALRAEGLQLR